MAVGAGYGNNKETQIRIANFPTHSIKQISELIDVLEKHIG
jgi:phosphoserine aminotransferase